MKVYIAGKITGYDNYRRRFAKTAEQLREAGHTVMNPAVLPDGFENHEYMRICYSMIDVCDAVYFMDNWTDSPGAIREHDYATLHNKQMIYEF